MTEEEANDLSSCGHGCYIIGGPWISTNPQCPEHGDDAREPANGVKVDAAAHACRLEFRPAAEAPTRPTADNFPQAVLYNQCDGFHLAFARFDSDGGFDGFYDWCGTDAYEPDKHFCAWALLPDSALLFEPFARKGPYVAPGVTLVDGECLSRKSPMDESSANDLSATSGGTPR